MVSLGVIAWLALIMSACTSSIRWEIEQGDLISDLKLKQTKAFFYWREDGKGGYERIYRSVNEPGGGYLVTATTSTYLEFTIPDTQTQTTSKIRVPWEFITNLEFKSAR